jgi:hypothetical protein
MDGVGFPNQIAVSALNLTSCSLRLFPLHRLSGRNPHLAEGLGAERRCDSIPANGGFSKAIASQGNTPHNRPSLRPRGPMIFRTIEQVRRFSRILAGFTFLLAGVLMFFTPGPGWLVVFLGLTLLGAEFVWARRLMDRMKQEGTRLKDTVLKFSKN